MSFSGPVPWGRPAGYATGRLSRVFAGTLGVLLLGLTGCPVRDYNPPLLPTFMREDVPAGFTPAPTPRPTDVPGLVLPGIGWAPLAAPPAQAQPAALPQPVVRVISVTVAPAAERPAADARNPAAEE